MLKFLFLDDENIVENQQYIDIIVLYCVKYQQVIILLSFFAENPFFFHKFAFSFTEK